MKKLTAGILAHVDAGKTTLSEALLYTAGSIRTLGRVDHKNAFLDSHELERQRGITIFSKQAQLKTDKMELCLLDTPGHVDFAAEAERTIQILDCAVLLISGTDGVQSHTETLWHLLRRNKVPTLVFVTKMDLPVCSREALMADIKAHLSENCLDFGAERNDEWYENAAMSSEDALEELMESGTLSEDTLKTLISGEKIFPVLFGSGLKLQGIEELFAVLEAYIAQPEYGDEFGAKVYKILRDAKGNRLSCMKITGGSLKNRSMVNGEKVTGLRIYSGAKFETTDEALPGDVVAVQGLSETFPGQGLGFEKNSLRPMLEPVLSYRINLPAGTDAQTALPKLRQLEDEDPMLRIVWNDRLKEICVQLMGQVQTEVLTEIIRSRFDMDVTIGSGGIMYKETIKSPVLGIGHYEPLRHYAEVHLALKPTEAGSGVSFFSDCREDVLDANWQNLILTNLSEKQHLGVLTGSPITDMSITLLAGKAHLKHTEGGDFRQAVYRAVRQGLMKAESVLLEPWYSFRIEVPPEQIGRAISDVRAMSGEFEAEGASVITGMAPVSEMNGYAAVLASYTSGAGRISCVPAGYRPCHNAESVIEEFDYKPEADLDNSPDSVFCYHGAGTVIKWNEVDDYAHLDTGFGREKAPDAPLVRPRNLSLDDKELEAIMEREFGPIRRAQYTKPVSAPIAEYSAPTAKTEYLIVDGYNVLFSWDELKKLSEDNLDLARSRLVDTLKSYRAFRGCELVLVFDGYKVAGNPGERDNDGIHVVYTKENETADMYIEKFANDIGKNYSVRVVTNDSLIRLSALRSGVLRMSSAEFINELEDNKARMAEFIHGKR